MRTRRIFVKKDSLDWKVDILWSGDKLRPGFNDGVIHDSFESGVFNNAAKKAEKAVKTVGIEPTTRSLKVSCSTG